MHLAQRLKLKPLAEEAAIAVELSQLSNVVSAHSEEIARARARDERISSELQTATQPLQRAKAQITEESDKRVALECHARIWRTV